MSEDTRQAGRRRISTAVAGGCVAALLVGLTGGASPAASASEGGLDGVSTLEQGCTELLVRRLGHYDAVDALVPDVHTPLRLPNGNASLYLYDYSCDAISVSGGAARPGLVHIGAALLTNGDLYLLWHGSDTRELVQSYRELGLPSFHVPDSVWTTTVTSSGTSVHVAVAGAGLDHQLTTAPFQVTPEPTAPEEGVTFVHDGSRGPLVLTSQVALAGPVLTGVRAQADWSGLKDPFRSLLVNPIAPGAAAFAIAHDMTTQLELVSSPRRPVP